MLRVVRGPTPNSMSFFVQLRLLHWIYVQRYPLIRTGTKRVSQKMVHKTETKPAPSPKQHLTCCCCGCALEESKIEEFNFNSESSEQSPHSFFQIEKNIPVQYFRMIHVHNLTCIDTS